MDFIRLNASSFVLTTSMTVAVSDFAVNDTVPNSVRVRRALIRGLTAGLLAIVVRDLRRPVQCCCKPAAVIVEETASVDTNTTVPTSVVATGRFMIGLTNA